MVDTTATIWLFLAACFLGPFAVTIGAGIVMVIARKVGKR